MSDCTCECEDIPGPSDRTFCDMAVVVGISSLFRAHVFSSPTAVWSFTTFTVDRPRVDAGHDGVGWQDRFVVARVQPS